jgi:Xaa-Pro aminopeptidase
MLRDLGSTGKRLGIENNAYGLTHFNGKQVEQALSGFCELVDASDLVSRLRAVKSPAELAYVRQAGDLGDAALRAGIEATRAGADEGEILAAQQAAIFAGGGDYPAMSSSSAPGPMPFSAATSPAAGGCRRTTSSPWSSPASIAIIMPRSCAR